MIAEPGNDRRLAHLEKMRAARLPELAIAVFLHHLDQLSDDGSGVLGRDQIEPVAELPDAERLAGTAAATAAPLDQVVVIKLNGGLGTGMGLDRAKSLIRLRDGMTFLDLIVRQIRSLRRTTGCPIPLLLMNSFRTAGDTDAALAPFPDLRTEGLPLGFLQHRVPKVARDGRPASHPIRPELEWCPPGHGDLYPALVTSGVLHRLLGAGFEYAFVSNADNLGAVLDPTLLSYMAVERIEFMMEAADRTPADRKGGHLCRLRDGRLALRESAQCPPDEVEEFQDVTVHRYFNTNSIWLRLPALERLLERHRGMLPLRPILNRKTLDPCDPSSEPVVQLETAMGSAISLFDRATAVRVPRHRFSPVKDTNDLLAVRSDAYRLTDDWRVVLDAGRSTPPVIALDDRYYKLIDGFEARFPHGPPSLVRCDALTVEGDVAFGAGVRVEGRVRLRGGSRQRRIEAGAVLSGDVVP